VCKIQIKLSNTHTQSTFFALQYTEI